jgi:hypothetical protein
MAAGRGGELSEELGRRPFRSRLRRSLPSACPQVLVIRGCDEEGAAPDTATAKKM